MRTSYTSLTPRRRRKFSWRAALVLVVVALAAGAVLWWRGPAADILWRAVGGTVALRNSFSASEVALLRDEVARATAAAADRSLLQEEVIALRALLGRSAEESERASPVEGVRSRVIASVLQRPPSVPYDTLLLDVGSRHGVAAGDSVYAGGTVALGEITEVHDGSARATLYSSPGREHEALLVGGGRAVPLVLVGQGGGSFVAQVPAGTEVAAGDPVSLPGMGGGMLSAVSAVVEKQGESFIKVYAHLPVNLFELRYVEVRTAR